MIVHQWKLKTSPSHQFPIMISLRESLATFALCVLIVLSSVEASSIRKRETKVEGAQFSHNYDASAPSRPFRVRIATYTEEVDALLTPTEGFLIGETTPVFRAYTKDGKLVYEKLNADILKDAIMFYQDSTNNAAVLVRAGERGPEFVGQIGNLAIAPSTASDAAAGKEKRSIMDDEMITDSNHVVFKVNEGNTRQADEATRDEIKIIQESVSDSRTKRDASLTKNVVYPTVLAVSSYKMTSETFDITEFYKALVYQMASWNGVDLRFRQLKGPAIRLRMAAFVIATDAEATPYFNACYSKDDCEWLNSVAVVSQMQNHWFELRTNSDFPLDSYDIAVASTSKSFTPWYDIEGYHDQTYLNAGQIKCDTTNGELKRPVAAIMDDGAFGGILPAAAALGAALGAKQDEINNMECNYNFGHIMGRSLIRLRGVSWSPCSQRQIKAFLSNAECLKAPKEHISAGNPLPKILPGHLTSPNHQCQKRGWTWACEVNEDTCNALKCYSTSGIKFLSTGSTCQPTGTPAEGTPCGLGKACIGGKCENMAHLVLLSDTL